MRHVITLGVALALLAGCSEGASRNPARPDAYAVRLPVSPAPGAPLQRLSVPAEALAALRAPDRSDLRIFDSTGAALPIAATAPPGGRAELRPLRLPALPIRGSGAAAGSTLSIEESADGRIVRVTQAAGKEREAGAAASGVLLDTRDIADPVRGLRLDARWPAQQPVSFAVEASEDLRDWTPLGGRVLYRKSDDPGGAIGDETIDLDDAVVKGRYVRVRWNSPSKLLGPVAVDGASLIVARRMGGDRPAIETMPLKLATAHELRFNLGHAIVPAAMRITPTGGETLIRVEIAGRNAPDQPWTPLGDGVLRQGESEAVALQGPAFTDYRIAADRRTAGFAAPPRVALLFEPVQLVTLFSGKPPYTLAAGAADADNRYLAIADLIPDAKGAVAGLPAATVLITTPPSKVALADMDDDRINQRETLLWALLLLGVTALALMVWRLWKPAK